MKKSNKCLRFLYNHEKKTILGRTYKSWGEILGYYFVFLAVMCFIFILMLYVCLVTTRSYRSLLKNQIMPMPKITVFPTPFLIIKNNPKSDDYQEIIEKIRNHFKFYKSKGSRDCKLNYIKQFGTQNSSISKPIISELYSCEFNISSLGPCSTYPYGYNIFKPCLFLKINKVLNWKPDPYLNYSQLPISIPKDIEDKEKSDIPKLWVKCNGKNDQDKLNIGNISYYPEQSFSSIYFPYNGNKQYRTPLVALQLNDLKNNSSINLQCYLSLQHITMETSIKIKVV